MSILAKGMKAPINCQACFVGRIGPRCYCGRKITTEEWNATNKRPSWCPLREVPEKHGRLIDMDNLKADYGMKDDCADCEKELRGKIKQCESNNCYTKMDFCGWLDDATVVIEAEGAE